MENISKLTPTLYDKGETNFNHNGLGRLTKLLANEIDEVLNGEFEAFFEYPANGHLADKIDNEMFIKAKPNKKDEPHVFKIYDYELDTFTQTYLIYARSKNIEDLRNNVVLDVNVMGLAPTQAWFLAKHNALDPVVTTFYSDITTTSSVHWERRSLLSTIAGQEGSMIQYWGGEIKHDINRISLLRRRGQDNVTTVRHGKNLDGLKATYSTKGLVTAIVPYYVKDNDKAVYGDVVESEYINNYPSTYYDIIEYNDEELGLTQEDEPEGGWEDSTIRTELNRVAKRYFDENVGKDLPSINMEISLEDISQTKEYENFKDFEQIEIGDTITVYSKKFDLNINAKVRRVVYNGLTDKNELVEVGTTRRSLYDDVRDEFKKVETELKEGIDHAMASADGKNTIYHGTADPNEVGLVGKNNDTYFRTNGQFKEIWSYLDGQWHLEVGDLTGEQIKADIAEQQQAIEEAKQTADYVVERINTDIAGKFTALDEEILAIEGISNSAKANAQTALTQSIDALGDASLALTNAQTAINTAGSAISSIQDINVEIDEINGALAIKADSSTVNALDGVVSNLSTEVGVIAGELSLKANSSTVDTLTGRVSTAETGITANANAIKLKASQSSVDTLTGRVNTLGAQIDVTAGQISSKVWNTDIQTAVDGIEVGGRNYLPLSKGDLISFTGYNTNWEISDKTIESVINRENHILNLTLSHSSLSEPIVNDRIITFSGFLKVNNEIPEKHPFVNNSLNTNATSSQTELEYNQDTGYFKATYPKRGSWLIHAQTTLVKGDKISIYKPKVEKGNKATDWTPAPEDTTALINHVESELTQKYDSITASVSSIDGRVAAQKLTLDGLTTTIQDVRKDLTGATTLLNTTRTTVSDHTSTIATLRTDVDGKATTTQFNTLSRTVDGTITRVGNAEGKITQIETNVSGLQTTVADKASQSQVTQLSDAYNIFVSGIESKKNLLPGMEPGSIGSSTGVDMVSSGYIRSPYIPVEPYSYYIASLDGSPVSFAIYSYSDIGQFISSSSRNTSYKSVGGAKYIRVVINNSNPYLKYQVERGVMVTPYTPFIGDVSSAQMSVLQNNINLRVTSTELNNAVSGKADKNRLITQINLSPDTALIQSQNILLDGDVTIRGTSWMDGAILKDLSVDGAKIQNATIGSAKIADLDVSKISGNTTEFVRSAWNAGIDNVTIDASGIYMTGSGAWRRTYLSATGFDLYNGVGGGNKAGAIGYLKSSGSEATYGENVMGNAVGGRHMIGIGVNASHDIAFGYNNDSTTNRFFEKSLQVDGVTGRIRVYRPLHPGNSNYSIDFTAWDGAYGVYGAGFNHPNSGIAFTGSGTKIWDESNKAWDTYNMTTRQRIGFYGNSGIQVETAGRSMEIWAGGSSVVFYTSTNSRKFLIGDGVIAAYADLNMNSYRILNQSDRRLKTDITKTNNDSLEKITNIEFVDFNWLTSGKDDFGIVAQQVQRVAPELIVEVEDGYLGINSTRLNMMTAHAVKELALRELNTNQVASQALQLVESIKSEIDELREENRDLRNRIEELESVV